ncbi:IclR family transcriptional regulator [Achromobacter aegrifaciens]|uniref:IclR family transcriptional regulator n=1 Tax=Achromobacter aegrifaciens TaxID=1287736 RepID=UPI000F747843|nr:IclR family transcriptional regulator [Achromobacter aegrifaciens]RSF05150.1 IclR family transcriptional regulator [Achromobacter aegrifaciens]
MSRASPRAPKNDATEDSAEPDRQFVTALARGLDILRCFSAERRMLGTTELAHLTGLAQPTVWRLCHTLQKTGFLAAVPGKDKLQLGIAAFAPGGAALAGQEALDIIRPMLQALADRYQVAVALGRRDGDSIVYLLRCQGNSPLLMNLRVGSRIPLFHSAIGWAYLACCSPEEREALLQEARASGKAGDATEQQAIADAIARYPERGFVYHERPAYQINTVAAAFALPAGERYVVRCGGPAALLPRQLMLDEAGPTLRQLAHELQPILLMGRHV